MPAKRPAPPAARPTPAAPPAAAGGPEGTWPCAGCGLHNGLSRSDCSGCGLGFLGGLHGDGPLLALPGVGDVARLGTAARLGLALAVALVLVALTVLAGALLP